MIYTLLHQYVVNVWKTLTLMLLYLGKDWNDDHNDGLRGKKNVSSYSQGGSLKSYKDQ